MIAGITGFALLAPLAAQAAELSPLATDAASVPAAATYWPHYLYEGERHAPAPTAARRALVGVGSPTEAFDAVREAVRPSFDQPAVQQPAERTAPPVPAPPARANPAPATQAAAPSAPPAPVAQAPVTAQAPVAARAPSGGAANARSAGLFAALNAERSALGLPQLRLTSDLSTIAQIRAEDMSSNGYFAHVSPTGESWLTLLSANQTRLSGGGENLARVAGDVERSVSVAVSALMDSPTHRANIVNSAFTDVGVAAVTDASGVTVFVTIFGTR